MDNTDHYSLMVHAGAGALDSVRDERVAVAQGAIRRSRIAPNVGFITYGAMPFGYCALRSIAVEAASRRFYQSLRISSGLAIFADLSSH